MYTPQVACCGNSIAWRNSYNPPRASKLQLNESRRKLCPNSPFFHRDFDLATHQKEWQEQMNREAITKAEQKDQWTENGRWKIAALTRRPFDGKKFKRNWGNVLCEETVFTPSWEDGKEEIAPWPSKVEMDYEGDGRVATDQLHGRFLPLPRLNSNDTVQWQHRTVVPASKMDDMHFIPTHLQIDCLRFWIGEHEFSNENEEVDEDGVRAITKEFLRSLGYKAAQ